MIRLPHGRPTQLDVRILPRDPPSPSILSSNLDSTFPPIPTKTLSASGRPGNANFQRYAEADATYGPVSPKSGTHGLLQRMNSIAPGPFNVKEILPTEAKTGIPRIIPDTRDTRQSSTSSGRSRSSTTSTSEGRTVVSGPRVPKVSTPEDGRKSFRLESRSQTFPLKNEGYLEDESRNAFFRRPSEPLRSSRGAESETKSFSTLKQRRDSASGRGLQRALPPRGTSLLGGRSGGPGNIPPVPNLDLSAEFGVSNPYHTSSTSQSSYALENGAVSSQSDLIDGRKLPEASKINRLIEDLEVSLPLAESQSLPREQFAIPRTVDSSMLSPESPMDPAFQQGRFSPNPLRPKPHTTTPPPRRPPTKGNCKGCSEPIKGKSVSSADGRLTGRYHKQCFVCNTCSEPFATTTFYVINDAPYCKRHYHKLNNSMCQACDRGIEGQYLETERKRKYHPNCLTCSDCRRVLRDDYFEMNSKVYCERDAYRRAQQRNFLGPGTNRMERRTTRLMVM